MKKNDELIKQESKKWWNKAPMNYDWYKTIKSEKFSREYFEESDRRLFYANYFAHKENIPFGSLINYEEIKNKEVLEVGCGFGAITCLMVKAGAEVSAIDYSERAVAATRKRFETFNLKAKVFQADAENLPFNDNSFPFVWSWGVLHHTPNTQKAIDEIYRVLEKDGKAQIMLYNKSSWLYWINLMLIRGVFLGKFLFMNQEELRDQYTDGFIAKYYTRKEIQKMFKKFRVINLRVFGEMGDIYPFPYTIKKMLFNIIPRNINDYFARRLDHFWFIEIEK